MFFAPLHTRRRLLKALIAAVAVLWLSFIVYDFFYPFKGTVAYATQVTDRNGVLLHAFLSSDDKWRFHTALHEVTPLLKKTFLFKEDNYFYYHPGVNPLAILRALSRNLLEGKRTSGASTITMQVARLLEPRPRTYYSKLVEMLHALQLEWHYSKDEILRMYFDLIPFGGNIEGVKAASLLYYGKPPQLLSLSEITTLTVIPNQPNRLQPGKHNEELLRARNKWLKYFREEGLFGQEVISDAFEEPVTAFRRAAPGKAPHLALRLKPLIRKDRIVSTVQANTQLQTEVIVSNYVNRIRAQNIHNAAVLVVNNETMEVEAYVGSGDFHNPYDAGQVDGIRAVRSPGSALKPLLYATAFDKGLVIPETILNDVPANFGGFEPENFDLRFNGPVSVEFALANSLNIPAVKLLQDLQMSAMLSQLKKSGFRTVEKQSGDLGLSLILGGCGVTLEELTRMFSAFAREGKVGSLRFLKGDSTDRQRTDEEALLSPEAAYMVSLVLSKSDRPDLPVGFDHTYRLPRIAWKTGTSYGKRDAWSIGYNRRYTIGVWTGNFSGEGVPGLSGAQIATPLLFELFNTLDYNAPKEWFHAPGRLGLRKVCALSGDIPAPDCDQLIIGHYIEGISPYRMCRHNRWVYTDAESRVSYCTQCLPASGYRRKQFPNLTPDLIAYYQKERIPYNRVPPHNTSCDRIFTEGAPAIVSPHQGSEYFLDSDESQQIQLSCHAALDVEEVTWFVNDKQVHKSRPSVPVFIRPPLGNVKISCSDDKGRNTDVFIVARRL